MASQIRTENNFVVYSTTSSSPGSVESTSTQKIECNAHQSVDSTDCIVIPDIELVIDPGEIEPRPIVPGGRAKIVWTLPKQLLDSKRVRSVIGDVSLAITESADAAPKGAKVSADAMVMHLRGGKTPLHRVSTYHLRSRGTKYLRAWTLVLDRKGKRLCASTFLFELRNGQACRVNEGKPKKP